MQDNYFKKAVVFGDAHFGRSSDSPVVNADNLDYLRWMIDRAKTWGAETCLFLGDFYHNRASVGVNSLQSALDGLEMLSAAFARVVMLIGNHDIARRATRGISTLNFSRHLPNIELVDHPLDVGNVTLLPWLVGDEAKALSQLRSRYVFGHLETIGAMMNARTVCTGSEHAVDPDTFKGPEHAFSGHFHQRQTLKNITYIGSIMPFDFSDANDAERGAMFLEWGRDPIFESWPDQPLYQTTTVATLLDNLHILRPRMTVRALVDIDLRYEETQELRETLINGYGLRKLELIGAKETTMEPETVVTELHTVDQIVIDGLRGLESAGMSNDRLISIFQGLPRN